MTRLEANQTGRHDALGDSETGRHGFRDAEAVFAEFVRNANAVGLHARTLRSFIPELAGPWDEPDGAPTDPEGTATSDTQLMSVDASIVDPQLPPEVMRDARTHAWSARGGQAGAVAQTVPLTRRKSPSHPPDEEDPSARVAELAQRNPPISPMQRMEALCVVPDVSKLGPSEPAARERSEDGRIPAGELDRMLGDMAVLFRYGHRADVRRHLDTLLTQYPKDLILRRQVAEFHLEVGDHERAKDCLFALSASLFERGNVHGMRQALEQVRIIDPDNERAARLLSLLDRRADGTSASSA